MKEEYFHRYNDGYPLCPYPKKGKLELVATQCYYHCSDALGKSEEAATESQPSNVAHGDTELTASSIDGALQTDLSLIYKQEQKALTLQSSCENYAMEQFNESCSCLIEEVAVSLACACKLE